MIHVSTGVNSTVAVTRNGRIDVIPADLEEFRAVFVFEHKAVFAVVVHHLRSRERLRLSDARHRHR
jgi:hypothetical protein